VGMVGLFRVIGEMFEW